MIRLLVLFLIFVSFEVLPQTEGAFQVARLKYNGGGDWYNDPSAEVNLLKYLQANTTLNVKAEYKFADMSSDEIFSYPFLFITGHGNVVFSNSEAERLKKYLENGGFLYIDDDYGLDKAIRREMKKVFPDKEFIEIPYSHKIYNILYDFSSGPPKTHKHDEKPPQGFGIFIEERIAVYYTFEANPSDGWADAEVHNDPEDKREEALKFGANIVLYALSN
jgi:hypothetical protein